MELQNAIIAILTSAKYPVSFRIVRIALNRIDARGIDTRLLDRTLQKMRKAGHIVYRTKATGGPGWSAR